MTRGVVTGSDCKFCVSVWCSDGDFRDDWGLLAFYVRYLRFFQLVLKEDDKRDVFMLYGFPPPPPIWYFIRVLFIVILQMIPQQGIVNV